MKLLKPKNPAISRVSFFPKHLSSLYPVSLGSFWPQTKLTSYLLSLWFFNKPP